MEKIWFIKSRWGNSGKVFMTEKAFLQAIREKDEREAFVFTLQEAGRAGDIKSALITARERNDQMRAILGEADKYEGAIMRFRQAFGELAGDCHEKRAIERWMKATGLNKRDFSSMATRFKNYLLFCVSCDEEWYRTLLSCHNFKSLPEYKYVNRTRVEADAAAKEAFAQAKLSLRSKKAVKNKKK